MKKIDSKPQTITLTPYHKSILSEMSAKTRINKSEIIRMALEKIYPVLMNGQPAAQDETKPE